MSTLLDMTKRQSNTARCLPADLVKVTPSCGIPCIRGWIDKNFNSPSCTSTSNLNFLCTTRTSIGLTIGEGAYQCLYSSCSVQDAKLFAPALFICNDVADAIPRQQTSLTATQDAGSVVTVTAPTATSSTLVTSITPAVATDTSARPPTGTGLFTSVSAPSATTTASQGTASPRLSKAEIAGATVGSAVGIFALLLLIFLFCKGRKPSEKKGRGGSDLMRNLPAKTSAYSSRDTSPVPPITVIRPQQAGDSATSASINAALQAATTPVTAITPTRPKMSPLQQNPHSRMRSFSQLDMKTETAAKPDESAELKPFPSPEQIGIAISPKQPSGFAPKATSMPVVQESPTIPIRNTQITVWSVASADSDEAPSGLAILQAKSYMPSSHTRKPSEQTEKEYTETDRIIGDVEAQVDAASPSSRTSFLSSARASMAEMGAAFVTLARAVSLKRQSPSPKVSETNTRKKPVRKPTPQQFRAPTTPKYDNGNIVMNAELPPVMPDPSLALAARARQPNTVGVQNFQDFKYGKLPATEPTFNKESRSEMQQGQKARLLGDDSRGHSRSASSESNNGPRASVMMTPPPLSIKKKSREGMKEKATTGEATPSRPKSSHSRNPSSSSLRSQKGTATSPYIRTQASRNQLVTMGLNSPDHVQHYAQKPLPAPSSAGFSTPETRTTTPPKLSAVATLAALKTSQSDLQRPPLPHAVSAPSDSMASILSPPSSIYSEATVFTQGFSSPPRGRPAFPPSKASQSSIATISTGVTLSAVTYKPSRSASEDKTFLQDLGLTGKAFAAGQTGGRMPPPPPPPSKPTPPVPQLKSTPTHIAQLSNTSLPPLPPLPTNMVAASKTPVRAVIPELAHLVNATGVTPGTGATGKDNGLLRTLSQCQSPASADPNRNSMTPKALFTPSRTVGGDLLLHVDHSVLNK